MSSALLAREWALLRGERGFGVACLLVLLLSPSIRVVVAHVEARMVLMQIACKDAMV